MNNITREEWLENASLLINEYILQPQEVSLPENVKVSVGFPSGSQTAIGQAWDKECSINGETFFIFISPTLGEDMINTLQVLAHECLHLAVGIDQKHGGEFKRVARRIGFEGKLTATYAVEGTPFYEQLQNILHKMEKEYGPYPHVPFVKKMKPRKEREKNIKFFSPENPEYIVSVKESVVENYGPPLDPEGVEMEILDS